MPSPMRHGQAHPWRTHGRRGPHPTWATAGSAHPCPSPHTHPAWKAPPAHSGPNPRHNHVHEPQANLVEVEHKVQLAHVAEVVVEDLHEQVDGLQAGQLVVRRVNAH